MFLIHDETYFVTSATLPAFTWSDQPSTAPVLEHIRWVVRLQGERDLRRELLVLERDILDLHARVGRLELLGHLCPQGLPRPLVGVVPPDESDVVVPWSRQDSRARDQGCNAHEPDPG